MFSWVRSRGFFGQLNFLHPLAVVFLGAPLFVVPLFAQTLAQVSPQNSEQLEVGAPPLHRAAAPPPQDTTYELEQRGDLLRVEKNFADAIAYYNAAIKRAPQDPSLFNKRGICQLMLQRYKEAKLSFEQSTRVDAAHADAYNNLGVTFYVTRHYNAAIKQYSKALSIDHAAASYYGNLGTAYFGKKQFDKAVRCYARAVELDPEIFDLSSRGGVQARLPSPEDRAHYAYVLAKMFAQAGAKDRSLHYLRMAMEEGYKDVKNAYKDGEFAALRKDPRFGELMAGKAAAISN